MSREIYVTGSKGMVGSRFLELAPQGYEVLSPEIDELNITDKEALVTFFRANKIDFLVHFAAYTNVTDAEGQRGNEDELCWKINVEGTRNLAEASKRYGAFMIYISTDMVFPGSEEYPGPYAENDKPEADPERVTWYGYTKARGEKVVQDTLEDNFAILRIIYPVRAKFDPKLDYVRKPLALFRDKNLYAVFGDQHVSISFIDEVVEAAKRIISERRTGIFHASSSDTATPHELVSYVIERATGEKDVVKESSLDEYLRTTGKSVRYSKYGGLKVERTEKELGIKFSTWRQIVDAIISQIST